MSAITNQFWVAANIILDLGTGGRSNVLMLVSNEREATVFDLINDATTYFEFVKRKAPEIYWSLEPPTPQRPQGYIIRGVQVINRA